MFLASRCMQPLLGVDQSEVSATLRSGLALTAIVSSASKLRQGAQVVAGFAPEHVVLVQLPIGRFVTND